MDGKHLKRCATAPGLKCEFPCDAEAVWWISTSDGYIEHVRRRHFALKDDHLLRRRVRMHRMRRLGRFRDIRWCAYHNSVRPRAGARETFLVIGFCRCPPVHFDSGFVKVIARYLKPPFQISSQELAAYTAVLIMPRRCTEVVCVVSRAAWDRYIVFLPIWAAACGAKPSMCADPKMFACEWSI